MPKIKILLDEDVWAGLALALRQAGYDAVSVHELKRQGLPDEEQMAFAVAEERAILTHNIQDFVPLVTDYFERDLAHFGVIVARHFEKGLLVRRTLALLETLTPETLAKVVR